MALRRTNYTGRPAPSSIGLTDFDPRDSDVLGSALSLGRQSAGSSPIAGAVSAAPRAAAPTPSALTGPSGGVQTGADVLRGSPLSSAPPPATGLPAAPTATPAATPVPTTPPLQPLPTGTSTYDPAKLNYEGNVYTGPPVETTTAALRAPTESDQEAIQGFMNRGDITISKDWRAELMADPDAFAKRYTGFNGLGEYVTQLLQGGTETGVDPSAKWQYEDQALYNQALQRQGQAGLVGAREDEENLLGMLESRGLLSSGIAARELGKIREARGARYQDAAARLNEILFSNAGAQAKSEALARLNAQLQRENEEALLRLRYDLEKQLEDERHRNDFMGFLGQVGGGIAGAATGGVPGAMAGSQLFGAGRRPTAPPYVSDEATAGGYG